MPTINFSKKDLLNLLDTDENSLDILPLIGIQLEAVDGDEMSVEVEANRADMFSVEGIARYAKGFLGVEKGFEKYEVAEGDFTVAVDRSVEKVRPYIGAAHVSGIKMDDYLIKSLMELQEKLHITVGRRRKKLAIGVHDSSKIGRDITYKAVEPDTVRFVPLGKDEEMSMREILEKHEKGRAYAHLLDGMKEWPLLVDEKGNVLSFPPVINGQLTALNENTTDIFIDMTGSDLNLIKKSLSIFCAALSDRGGKIESSLVKYPDREIKMPEMGGESMDVSLPYISALTGIEMSPEDAVKLLEKTGFSAEIAGENMRVRIPSYRIDMLHPADIAEEIAISYGYQNMVPELPKSVTFGRRSGNYALKKSLEESLIGLGFNEIMTLSLTNPHEEFEKMNMERENGVAIKNPVTEFHTSVRSWLLPSLMGILSKNRHRDLPQKIFEISMVVDRKGKNRMKLAGAVMEGNASFTMMKAIAERILSDIGLKMNIGEKVHPSFIPGRCASLIFNGEEIGFFGEISPEVLVNFELGHPVSAFEMLIDRLQH